MLSFKFYARFNVLCFLDDFFKTNFGVGWKFIQYYNNNKAIFFEVFPMISYSEEHNVNVFYVTNCYKNQIFQHGPHDNRA